jgi:hypothetical protein
MILGIPNEMMGQKLKPDEVPDDIKQSFEFEHPAAVLTGWVMEEGNFVASFKEDGTKGKAYISNDGAWMRSTYDIPKNELPSAITEYVRKNYPMSAINVSMLEATPEERLHYYIEVKHEIYMLKNSVLTFTDRGDLIKRVDADNYAELTQKKNEPRIAEKNIENEVSSKTSEKATREKPAREIKEKPQKEKIVKEKIITDEWGNVALKPIDVPVAVSAAFDKRARLAENIYWYFIDSLYVAKGKVREQQSELAFRKNGQWVSTKNLIDKYVPSGNILKYLNAFYKDYKIKQAFKETRADKQDKMFVDIYEKENIKSKLATTIIFDKMGNFVNRVEPHIAMDDNAGYDEDYEDDLSGYYDKISMGIGDEGFKNIPSPVAATFRAKYPKIKNAEWGTDDEGNYCATYMGIKGKEICVIGEAGTLLQLQTMGRPELLSANIQDFIKKNYKGYKADDYYAVKDVLEKKNYYKVFIMNKKTGDRQALWFLPNGQPVTGK